GCIRALVDHVPSSIFTLSLHDALPIYLNEAMFLGDRIAVMRDGRIVQIGTPEDILTDPANDYVMQFVQDVDRARVLTAAAIMEPDRKSTRLNSSHVKISYADFCLKQKK